MSIRFPTALTRGSRIGITAPSTGISADLEARFQYCLSCTQEAGFELVVGNCLRSAGIVSAPALQRAEELSEMLLDRELAAVVPPWGGELLVQVLPLLDFEKLGRAQPKWLVGFSDLSTLLLPYTLKTGIATLHGANFMETGYRAPDSHTHWLQAVKFGAGHRFSQASASSHQVQSTRYQEHPQVSEWNYAKPVSWKLLGRERDESLDLKVHGRLIGGCLDVISMLPGTAYGEVDTFVRAHAPDGLLFYVENCEEKALTACRMLHHLRLAGWFKHANAILVGRTSAADCAGFSQKDAIEDALASLDVPIIYDVDIGHVPPQMLIVNGAMGEFRLQGNRGTLLQQLE